MAFLSLGSALFAYIDRFIETCIALIRRPKRFPAGLARLPVVGQGWKGTKPSLHLWRTHKLMGHFVGNGPAVTVQDFHLAKGAPVLGLEETWQTF